jgi:hypothetical protein
VVSIVGAYALIRLFVISLVFVSEWKKCKYFGTMLDTKEDIKRRKSLAITAASKLNNIFNNKRLTITTKTAVFKTYRIHFPVQLRNMDDNIN